MVLAKRAGLPPRDLATASPMRYLTTRSSIPATSLGPANFFINAGHHTQVVSDIEDRGWLGVVMRAGRRVQVEFVSITPPAHCMSGMAGVPQSEIHQPIVGPPVGRSTGVLLQRRAADQQSGTVCSGSARQTPMIPTGQKMAIGDPALKTLQEIAAGETVEAADWGHHRYGRY